MDSLDVFFAAQRARVVRTLETRCGTLKGIEDQPARFGRDTLEVTVRGNGSGHHMGPLRPTMDHQGGTVMPVLNATRRTATWANLERIAGRLAPYVAGKEASDAE